MENITCSNCKESKHNSEFGKNKTCKTGFEYQCKSCRKEYYSDGRAKRYYMKSLYGITIEEYDRLVEKQGGVCAICGGLEPDIKKARLSIDHNHDTGEIRGLLCSSCNMALGLFKDDINSLRKAIEYLTH